MIVVVHTSKLSEYFEKIRNTSFLEQFGVSMEQIYGEVLKKMEKQELLINKGDMVCLTKKGLDVSNYVMAEFLFDD